MSAQHSEVSRLRARIVELESRLGELRGELLRKESRGVQLRAALDHAADQVVVMDARGTVLYANRAFAEDLDAKSEELAGMPAMQVSRRPVDVERMEQIAKGIAERGEARLRFDAVGADGSLRTRDASFVSIPEGEAEVGGVVGVIRDVTNEASLEAQLRRSQRVDALGRLAGSIAHDFNNMLTVIGGLSEILAEDLPRGTEEAETAELIRDAVGRASALTRQLLAFSGHEVRDTGVLDLNELIRNLEGSARRLGGEGVRLVTELDPNPCTVLANASQLEQVVRNLLANARDAVAGDGQILVSTRVAEDRIELEVRDDGEGMSDAVQAQIFDPFFTTRDVGEGSGLGLTTVFRIVEQSGGEIDVRSEPGAGASFTVSFPRVAPRQPTAARADAEPTDAQPEGKLRGTVLVVDDERHVARTTGRILRQMGFRVLQAESGARALELLKQAPEPIDLLLADVVMPDIGGVELVERIHEIQPSLGTLLMSGYATHAGSDSAMGTSNVRILPKPFTTVQLRQAVVAAMHLEPADPH